jgi:hypothetical protein
MSDFFSNTGIAKITGGELYEYLKDIDLLGIVTEENEFVIFGCKDKDQDRFYKGLLEYDKVTDIQGFKTVKQVKRWWEEEADMQLYVEAGAFKVIELLKTT